MNAATAVLEAPVDDLVPPPAPLDPRGLVGGRLLGLADEGRTPLVALADGVARRARSLVELHGRHLGGAVLLGFEQGDPARPVVLGLLRDPASAAPDRRLPVELRCEGQRLHVSATSELVLRCGKARLTLCSDGRIEILGETIVTRATGPNKVQGGSVELN